MNKLENTAFEFEADKRNNHKSIPKIPTALKENSSEKITKDSNQFLHCISLDTIKYNKKMPSILKKLTSKIKIRVYGSSKVGKSSFIDSLLGKEFSPFYKRSKGIEIRNYKMNFNKIEYNIEFLVESFDDYTQLEIPDSDFVFIFFDFENDDSFKDSKIFLDNIFFNKTSSFPYIFLIGNKCELKKREFDYYEIDKLYNNYEIFFFEISVKDNIGISDIKDKIQFLIGI